MTYTTLTAIYLLLAPRPSVSSPPRHTDGARQVVRDLAWAFSSPHLLSSSVSEHDVTIFTDAEATATLTASHEWLAALDADPTHLLKWVAVGLRTSH